MIIIDIHVDGNLIINYTCTDIETDEKSIHKIRTSNAVTTAKKNVKSRDMVCQCCGEVSVNGHLEVHHILPISKYKGLASDEGNLIALCQKCHRKYHDMYSDEDVNAVTFSKFLKDFGNRIYR